MVACYDIYEIELRGPENGNPFRDITLSAKFWHKGRVLEVEGFYDGEGVYRIRCMPDEVGEWQFETFSNSPELNSKKGVFQSTPARSGVHGPVRVAGVYHFAYADGTPHRSFGTTCYAWVHQEDELEVQTLATLRQSPFNKIRMCIFPKHYSWNLNEPILFAFDKDTVAGADWDFMRYNPAFFRHFEQRIGQLADLGIEADIILFHPYDRWGFSNMGAEADDCYLRYVIARLAAFRNVWWSLANEYDIMGSKSTADWDRLFRLVQTYDPYQHLRSVHNWQGLDVHDCKTFYDYGKPWVTHCSVQHAHVDLVSKWREMYRKPVVVDECCYEGDVPNGLGNLTPQEMTRRFWEGMARGGYVGHGETYLHPQDILWWSKGGILHGESPQRIAFLRKVIEEMPGAWLEPVGEITNTHIPGAGIPGKYYLTYFGVRQPGEVTIYLPVEGEFLVDILDTWEMTVTPVLGAFRQTTTIRLPAKPYIAIRIMRT